jgi:outer membrane biosynthesis protein TonB
MSATHVVNPNTGKLIKIGGPTYNRMMKLGHLAVSEAQKRYQKLVNEDAALQDKLERADPEEKGAINSVCGEKWTQATSSASREEIAAIEVALAALDQRLKAAKAPKAEPKPKKAPKPKKEPKPAPEPKPEPDSGPEDDIENEINNLCLEDADFDD